MHPAQTQISLGICQSDQLPLKMVLAALSFALSIEKAELVGPL